MRHDDENYGLAPYPDDQADDDYYPETFTPLDEEVIPDDHRATWAPVDLTAILDGTYRPAVPELLTRTDGVSLLYRGLTHSFHGESESGKSMVAQYLAAVCLTAQQRVLYLDYESDAPSVVGRVLMFGASPPELMAGFVYVQPEADPKDSATELAAWLALCRQSWDLVVLDGVTGSMVASRTESKDNDGVTLWSRRIPERLARDTGAAVVMIDHVPKDSQTRGRFAIGAQAKLGRITGAAFNLEPKSPIGQGLAGVIAIRLAKDRPGQLRKHTGPWNHRDRTGEIALFVLDSTQDIPSVTVKPPERDAPDKPFRPTALMESISKHLEIMKGGQSKAQVEQNVTGKAAAKRTALEILVSEGYVTSTPGARGSVQHTSAKPYRQADDHASDVYTG